MTVLDKIFLRYKLAIDRMVNLLFIFKYLANPLEALVKYVTSGVAYAHLKNGQTILISKPGASSSNKLNAFTLGGLLRILRNGWEIVAYDDNLYLFTHKSSGVRLLQPNQGALLEDLVGEYLDLIDVNNKVVFDVGGYLGETAVFFAKIGGAKQVVVYEPVPQHVSLIKSNVEINGLSDKIIVKPFAVGNKVGTVQMRSALYSSGFGISRGQDVVVVKAMPWVKVIQEAKVMGAYLIKVDCEGCEKYLIDVSCQDILSIPNWIIETHNRGIHNRIISKFKKCGFKLLSSKRENEEITLLTFSKA